MDRKIHEDGKGDKNYKDSVHDMTQEAHRGGIHRSTVTVIDQMNHMKHTSGETVAPAHQGFWKR